MSGPTLYLIAGEPSGDRLGAALMRALRREAPGARVMGIGGSGMRAEGLAPLFGIEQLSVMGLTEVLPRLPTLLRLLSGATEDVLRVRPDILVTIDAPSFGLRVAERVRRRAPDVRTVHYVAPSVWAWRPRRARHMARFVDHVLALLPFEPPYMRAAGMSASFVGHPIAEIPPPTHSEISAFRSSHGLGAETPLLLVAPGSRASEISRHGPVLSEAVARLGADRRGLHILLPQVETTAEPARAVFSATGLPIIPLTPELDHRTRLVAFASAQAGLLKSGTVGLEAAAAGVPHVSFYRASFLTAAIVRRLVQVDTAHIVNLVAGQKVIPELFQEDLTPEALVDAARPLLGNAAGARARQSAAIGQVMTDLGRGGTPPSERAAKSILQQLG